MPQFGTSDLQNGETKHFWYVKPTRGDSLQQRWETKTGSPGTCIRSIPVLHRTPEAPPQLTPQALPEALTPPLATSLLGSAASFHWTGGRGEGEVEEK